MKTIEAPQANPNNKKLRRLALTAALIGTVGVGAVKGGGESGQIHSPTENKATTVITPVEVADGSDKSNSTVEAVPTLVHDSTREPMAFPVPTELTPSEVVDGAVLIPPKVIAAEGSSVDSQPSTSVSGDANDTEEVREVTYVDVSAPEVPAVASEAPAGTDEEDVMVAVGPPPVPQGGSTDIVSELPAVTPAAELQPADVAVGIPPVINPSQS